MEQLSIVLVAIAAIFGTLTTTKWKDLSTFGRVAMIFSCLACGSAAYVSYKKIGKERNTEMIAATVGAFDLNDGRLLPWVAFGMGANAPIIRDLPQGELSIRDYTFIRMYVRNDSLLASLLVKDSTGKPILSVYNSEWQKYSNDYEFNYDAKGIEIVTQGDRVVVFHMTLIGQIVHVEGTLYASNTFGINFFTGQKYSGFQILGPGVTPDNSKVPRMFKYPRELNIGVRETSN